MDIDLEVLYWIGKDPASLLAENATLALITDPVVYEVYDYVLKYHQEYRAVPDQQIIEHEFLQYNLQFQEPVTHLADLVERLKDRYAEKEAEKAVYEVGKTIVQDPRKVASKMLEEGRRLGQVLDSRRDIYDSGSIDRAILAYHKRVARGKGPSLGFRELDDHFHGMEALTYLVATPGGAKTWMGIKSMIENVRSGKSVYWAGLEMDTATYEWRLLCMAANIPFWKFQHSKLDDQDMKCIERSAKELAQCGDYIIEKPKAGQRSPYEVFARAQRFNADVMYVDQLQYLESDRGKALGDGNKTEEFFQVCNVLKDFSDEMPIYCIHQYNRTVLGTNEFPEMQQVKSSSAIEETATIVLGLYATKAMRQDNILQIGTLKTRNEAHAIWELEIKMRKGCSIDLVDRVDV